MSSENNINIPPCQDSKDENHLKTSSTRPQEQPQKCPRCDSPNTKFCYYNNYSLSQPRHFCKTCRRYWTKGGALRSVPIGGGCRKSKKAVIKSASSRFSGHDQSRDSSSPSDQLGGFKFFQDFSSQAMDFQLGGISLPRLQPSSCFSLDPSGSSVSLMGFNNSVLGHQSASASSGLTGAIQEMGSMSFHANIASSIESLSSMNQDLHWKLQQQRLASQSQKPQELFFQNLEISRQQACGVVVDTRKEDSGMATEWFFGNSYLPVNQNPGSSDGGNNTSMTNWNGVHAWGDLQQYSSFP